MDETSARNSSDRELEGGAFFPVPIRAVVDSVRLPFAVYVRIEEQFVEFIPANASVSNEALSTLQSGHVDHLWLQDGDSIAYFEFTTQVMLDLANDQSLDTYEKGAAIEEHAVGATRDLLCSMPQSEATANRLEGITEGIIQFLELHAFSFTRLTEALGKHLDVFHHSVRTTFYGVLLGRTVGVSSLPVLGQVLLLHSALDHSPPPRNVDHLLATAGFTMPKVACFHDSPSSTKDVRGLANDDQVRVAEVACEFDRLTAQQKLPTFEAARTMLRVENKLDTSTTRSFVGLLAQ